LANCLVAKEASTAPQTEAKDSLDEGFHFDALRAAVITSVTGSVIAVASGLGLPVSTTYVSFAAVISTGWADRIFHTGDAVVQMGRTIWVVFCWFFFGIYRCIGYSHYASYHLFCLVGYPPGSGRQSGYSPNHATSIGCA